ncbi:MAG: hypothetical protein AAB300_02605 [Nitrospirota bacterium]
MKKALFLLFISVLFGCNNVSPQNQIDSSGKILSNALWVWPAKPNRNNPFEMKSNTMRAELIDRASQSNVNHLFIDLYYFPQNSSGRLLYEGSEISDLVASAHNKKISVWASYGDASWADPAAKEWPGASCDSTVWPMARLSEVIGYNKDNPTAKIDGVMLNVEPSSLHPENALWLAGLLQLLDCAHRKLAPEGIKLSVSIRFFWNDLIEYPQGGSVKPMYQQIIDMPIDLIVVAGYRDFAGIACTDNGLICLDQDEMTYANSVGRKNLILVGVETQDCGDGSCSGSIETFFEEGQIALNRESKVVINHFSASLSFGGIAIHHYLDTYLGNLSNWPAYNKDFPRS